MSNTNNIEQQIIECERAWNATIQRRDEEAMKDCLTEGYSSRLACRVRHCKSCRASAGLKR